MNHYYFSSEEITQARSLAKKLKTKNELWKQLTSLDAITETTSSEEELELLYAVIAIHKAKCQSCQKSRRCPGCKQPIYPNQSATQCKQCLTWIHSKCECPYCDQ